MIEIRVEDKTPHRARVFGASEKTITKLDEALSFKVEGADFIKLSKGLWNWDGKQHLLSKVGNSFPIGLLSYAEEVLKKLGAKCTVVDGRKLQKFKPVKADFLKDITLAPHQLNTVNTALSEGGGLIHLATNAGKTECGCAIVKAIDKRTLWIVPTRILLTQTRERIAKRLNVAVSEIGAIGNGKFDVKKITVAIASSLYPRKARKEDATVFAAKQLRVKNFLKTVEVIVGDEVHHSGSQTWWKALSSCPAYYRFGLSGTPLDRTDGKNLLVEALCGKVIARVTNDDLIKIGWSAKPTIEFYEVNSPDLRHCKFWQAAYREGVVENTTRNEIIVRRAMKDAKNGLGVLILCREIDHLKALKAAFDAFGIAAEMAHAQQETHTNERAISTFVSGKSNILIGSPMFGEGVDFPGERIRVLVNAEGLKSVIRTLQKIGRGVRKKKDGTNTLTVIEFADLSNKYLANHSLERLKTYEREGFEIKEAA